MTTSITALAVFLIANNLLDVKVAQDCKTNKLVAEHIMSDEQVKIYAKTIDKDKVNELRLLVVNARMSYDALNAENETETNNEEKIMNEENETTTEETVVTPKVGFGSKIWGASKFAFKWIAVPAVATIAVVVIAKKIASGEADEVGEVVEEAVETVAALF
jgi:hypothetical protein